MAVQRYFGGMIAAVIYGGRVIDVFWIQLLQIVFDIYILGSSGLAD